MTKKLCRRFVFQEEYGTRKALQWNVTNNAVYHESVPMHAQHSTDILTICTSLAWNAGTNGTKPEYDISTNAKKNVAKTISQAISDLFLSSKPSNLLLRSRSGCCANEENGNQFY